METALAVCFLGKRHCDSPACLLAVSCGLLTGIAFGKNAFEEGIQTRDSNEEFEACNQRLLFQSLQKSLFESFFPLV